MRPKQALILTSIAFVLGATIATAQTVTYKYDDLGRVVQAVQASMSTTYSYDTADNRILVQTVVGTSSSSSSGGTDHAPTCNNWGIAMSNVPTYAGPVSGSLPAASFISNCTDVDGDTLTVTTPATPYSFTVSAHQTITVPFTVSDGRGGTGSAILTISRP